jgi:hypothetical protein
MMIGYNETSSRKEKLSIGKRGKISFLLYRKNFANYFFKITYDSKFGLEILRSLSCLHKITKFALKIVLSHQ